MSDPVRWKRALIEGMVIVGSILLAFGIDAGWDARDEASRRSAVIEGLRSDFATARADLDRVTAFHLEGRQAAEALMRIGAGGRPLSEDLSSRVDSLFGGLAGTASFDPPLGTLEALINSGDLDLLDDPGLAVELTRFQGEVVDLDREQRFARENLIRLFEYLGSEGIGTESFVTHPAWTVPWELQSDGVYRVVHEQEFRGWVTLMWALYSNTTGGLAELDEVLTTIEARLAEAR
jgi:hypothetical protein